MHQSTRRKFLITLSASTSLVSATSFAQTEGKPLRLIVPLSPGSTGDTVARKLAGSFTKTMSRPVVVENIAGAGGLPGTTAMVRSAKEGNTLAIVASTHVINPSIYKSMPFDAINDVTQIAAIGGTPGVLLIHPSVPAQNLKELIAYAKAHPGKLNYGSSGNGTNLHLLGVMLAKEAGIDIVHIPYKGNGPMVTDLVGGQIQLAFQSTPAGAAFVKAGTLRAIGISTRHRSRLLANVPTLAEQGLPNYDLGSWFMILGPAGMPAAMVAQLNSQINSALVSPELQSWFDSQDYTMMVGTSDQASAFMKSELVKHAKLVKDSGAVME